MQTLIRELTRVERPALEAHFLALGANDRRLRFGGQLSDSAIRAYVKRIDFERDALFGVSGEDLRLVGVGHVGRGDGHAELAIGAPLANFGQGRLLIVSPASGQMLLTIAGQADGERLGMAVVAIGDRESLAKIAQLAACP